VLQQVCGVRESVHKVRNDLIQSHWWTLWLRRSMSARARLEDKALGALYNDLDDAQLLLNAPQPRQPYRLKYLQTSLTHARSVLGDKHRRHDEDAIWLLQYELQCALAEVGDVGYLSKRLDEELMDRPSDPDYLHLTSDQRRELETLQHKFTAQAGEDRENGVERAVDQAIRILTRRYHLREHARLHNRARDARRDKLLRWVALGLVVLVLGLAFAIQSDPNQSRPDVWMAVLSAMLGSGIAGTRRLRDELLRIGQLDAFVSAFLAQLAVGAGLGLIVLLLLDAGMLGVVEDPQPSTIAVYAFAAGFSEPFVLGAIQGLAAAHSDS
jgi:hypothetical protein